MARSLIGSARTASGTRTIVFRSGIINSNFENAPSFTAAATTAARWIDGTATGSTTNDQYRWGTNILSANSSVQFDSSTSNSGANSLKVAKTAGGSGTVTACNVNQGDLSTVSIANQVKYGIPVTPNTTYRLQGWYKQTSKAAGTTILSSNTYSGASTARLASVSCINVASTVDVGWTLAGGTFTTGSTAIYLLIIAGVTSFTTGTVWFDDIYLTNLGAGRSLV